MSPEQAREFTRPGMWNPPRPPTTPTSVPNSPSEKKSRYSAASRANGARERTAQPSAALIDLLVGHARDREAE